MPESTLEATAYLRSYTPTSEPQNEVIAALDHLTREGVFDRYTVQWVPKAVQRGGEPTAVERLYERCLDWAREHDVDVTRPFDVQVWDNPVTGEHVDRLVTPVVCLTVRADGELVAVLPCEDGDETISVPEYLNALRDERDLLGTLPERERVVTVP